MNTKNLTWENLNAQTAIPEIVKPWLIDDQSLTHKLKQKFGDFNVNVLSQMQTQVYENERILINTQADCIVREVELLGNQQVVVFARSIIPITHDTKDLHTIGSKPLGEILFNDSNIVRGRLQITHTDGIWGRQSTFTVGQTRLLVSEFFLDNLYA
ncbi:Chorismate--pyruvate lyase [Bathymodiolus heckerae thiotrophic gill symbiont]|uniref:chorismate--pyruvate lyase family protein n=1 Tax=Bathymodiolus heckerae thiotrophic gill symbiont TaxID=1052212 RepID=UPI0010B75C87|nr:chorismate lyase [Bathymodiolus heckerae thiotrophic gill symbiont]SMN13255.1 Chorismate--pyruvate lyase [Bathymodiolus heckerae thiotrophic gill symbiont]